MSTQRQRAAGIVLALVAVGAAWVAIIGLQQPYPALRT
jgi:hypothetical protein